MSNLPVKFSNRPRRKDERVSRSPRTIESDAIEVISPRGDGNPFFSFRYSYTEISARGGRAQLKSKKTRFEDGKLTSESFEGELDRSAYEQAVGQAQRDFVDQTSLFLKSLWSLLPFPRR